MRSYADTITINESNTEISYLLCLQEIHDAMYALASKIETLLGTTHEAQDIEVLKNIEQAYELAIYVFFHALHNISEVALDLITTDDSAKYIMLRQHCTSASIMQSLHTELCTTPRDKWDEYHDNPAQALEDINQAIYDTQDMLDDMRENESEHTLLHAAQDPLDKARIALAKYEDTYLRALGSLLNTPNLEPTSKPEGMGYGYAAAERERRSTHKTPTTATR
jgi:hypothetical protein